MLSTIRALVLAAAKPIAAVILGGAIIWEVTVHTGSPWGTVYVHVTGGDGDVMIDDTTYHVRAVEDSPIVRELRPGRHVVRMARDGHDVFEQEFALASGEDLVLTAWDSSLKSPVSEPSKYSPQMIGSPNKPAPVQP